jgi:hypothetical protein
MKDKNEKFKASLTEVQLEKYEQLKKNKPSKKECRKRRN